MRRIAMVVAVAVVAATAILALVPAGFGAGGSSAHAADTTDAPSLASQLRYIGRDGRTGMPTRVGDAFIAEQERAIERYGKDEREPVPPPPASGVDLAELRIPALAIDAAMGRYGLDAFGRLDVPQDRTTVGWHPAYSAMPGEGGSTFLAGHYTYGGQEAVFFDLRELAPGSVVTVMTDEGARHDYRVKSTIDYELGVVDMGALLQGLEGRESLTLMTCSGRFVDGTYDYRTVVLAERIES